MADAVKCCICEHYIFGSNKCSVYPKGIPQDIFIEDKECLNYSKKETTDKIIYPIVTQGR